MTDRRFIELSHVIRAGMITYPGLPAPEITPHLTREASRERYASGTEFAMDVITMIGNTGTYLDAPWHRFADGADLLAGLGDVRGHAVVLHTGNSARFGTPDYATDPTFLTRDGARWLVEQGAALVGIDAINIDDMADGTRPAHTQLLQAGIPVVEHLTGLEQLPQRGARFTAVPPRVAEFGTFPVRAFATVDR